MTIKLTVIKPSGSSELIELKDELLLTHQSEADPSGLLATHLSETLEQQILEQLVMDSTDPLPSFLPSFSVEPAQTFGDYDLRKIQTVRATKELERRAKVGQRLAIPGGVSGTVVSIARGRITLDTNHPLAGSRLEVEVSKIRQLGTDETEIFLHALRQTMLVYLQLNQGATGSQSVGILERCLRPDRLMNDQQTIQLRIDPEGSKLPNFLMMAAHVTQILRTHELLTKRIMLELIPSEPAASSESSVETIAADSTNEPPQSSTTPNE